MKKFTKVCLILAASFAGIGVILVILGFCLGASVDNLGNKSWGSNIDNVIIGWFDEDEDLETDGNANKVNGEETFYYKKDDVESLDVEIKAGSLIIKESKDDEIHLTITGKGQCGMDGKTLKIKDNSTKFFGFGTGGLEVELYLPSDMEFDEIDLEVNAGEVVAEEVTLCTKDAVLKVDAGSIQVADLVVVSKLDAEVGAGEIDISKLDANDAEFDCGLGEITIAGTLAGDVTADCGMGEIHIATESAEEEFNYEIECGMGEIEIGDSTYTSLGEKTKLGNGADKTMKLDCGMGAIMVEFR